MKKMLIIAAFALLPLVAFGQEQRANALLEIEKLKADIAEREKILLSPSKEDTEANSEFLKQENTGIIRLLPREKFDRKLLMIGGGAYYSFSRKSHEYGNGSDLQLGQKYLSSGFAGANYGFMLDLGETALENISPETPGIRFMAEYAAPAEEAIARQEARNFAENGKAGKYNMRLKYEAGKSYALRSINYGFSDILAAFRIIREDSDGSLIIIWKKIKEFEKPQLRR